MEIHLMEYRDWIQISLKNFKEDVMTYLISEGLVKILNGSEVAPEEVVELDPTIGNNARINEAALKDYAKALSRFQERNSMGGGGVCLFSLYSKERGVCLFSIRRRRSCLCVSIRKCWIDKLSVYL